MSPKANSVAAKAAPKHRVRAKGKAKAMAVLSPKSLRRRQALRRSTQLADANRRQMMRRAAVTALNQLCDEILPGTLRIPTKVIVATDPRIERLTRALEPRCQTRALATRLRIAVRQWVEHGGSVTRPIADGEVCDIAEADDIAYHRVLQPGYTLHSKAFMLTYNSSKFGLATWPAFKTWLLGVRKRLGARWWAACLEESTHAKPTADGTRYHLHAYLRWSDTEGVFCRNLEPFKFQSVLPNVQMCIAPVK